ENRVALIVEILVKAHAVLKAGAASADDLNPKAGVRLRLFGKNFLHLFLSLLCQCDRHFVYLLSGKRTLYTRNYSLEVAGKTGENPLCVHLSRFNRRSAGCPRCYPGRPAPGEGHPLLYNPGKGKRREGLRRIP